MQNVNTFFAKAFVLFCAGFSTNQAHRSFVVMDLARFFCESLTHIIAIGNNGRNQLLIGGEQIGLRITDRQ